MHTNDVLHMKPCEPCEITLAIIATSSVKLSALNAT